MTNFDKKKVLTMTISDEACPKLPSKLIEADKALDNTYDILNKKKYFYKSQMRMNTFELISYRLANEKFDAVQFVIPNTTDFFNNKSRWIKILREMDEAILNNAYLIIPGKICKAKSILGHLLHAEDDNPFEKVPDSDNDKRIVEVKNKNCHHELQSAITYALEEEYEKKSHTSLTSDFKTLVKTLEGRREHGA